VAAKAAEEWVEEGRAGVAEVLVALWRREGWPQQGMTSRHYAALAGMVVEPARIPTGATPTDLPGGVRVTRLPGGWLSLRQAS
jgi:hypothetical protein